VPGAGDCGEHNTALGHDRLACERRAALQ